MLKNGFKGWFCTTLEMSCKNIHKTSGSKVAIETSASIWDRTQIDAMGMKQPGHLLEMGHEVGLVL